jgi:hypothetical protein
VISVGCSVGENGIFYVDQIRAEATTSMGTPKGCKRVAWMLPHENKSKF